MQKNWAKKAFKWVFIGAGIKSPPLPSWCPFQRPLLVGLIGLLSWFTFRIRIIQRQVIMDLPYGNKVRRVTSKLIFMIFGSMNPNIKVIGQNKYHWHCLSKNYQRIPSYIVVALIYQQNFLYFWLFGWLHTTLFDELEFPRVNYEMEWFLIFK